MEKIKKLRKLFKGNKIDGYIISKNDEFFGSYTSKEKDRLNYISNFSGSYGFALILKNINYLFVDGRYTLQAKAESGNFFKIKMIPKDLPKYIIKNKIYKIGYDPRLFTSKILFNLFEKSNCKLIPITTNLIDKIRNTKQHTNIKKFYSLPDKSVGYSFQKKIKKVVGEIKKSGADLQFISSCENSAWLLNIRGEDSLYSPIPHCYILLERNYNVNFFCDLKKISPILKRKYKKINFIDIKSVNFFLSSIKNKKILIDAKTCSKFFESIISKNNKIIGNYDSIYDHKSIKTQNEINNIKKAHIYDGAALTKYLFWIKNNFLKKKITEIGAEKKLLNLRKKNKNFKFASFPTISGTGPNGAIIHYKATQKTNRKLEKGDLYLVDSGGQYSYGTTDVTRTLSLKNTKREIKNIFTRVLKGHIAVASFQIKKNTNGGNIDKEARKYLKQINLDYPHGTGHGVGYFLNVHEGPQAISKNNKVRLEKGTVISNEPGFYKENKFGIRIENLIYVKKKMNKKIFDNLTMVPIDKDLIEISLLNKNEKDWINKYHKRVLMNLRKFMNKKEATQLKQACSAI